jgi:hypothetical protein
MVTGVLWLVHLAARMSLVGKCGCQGMQNKNAFRSQLPRHGRGSCTHRDASDEKHAERMASNESLLTAVLLLRKPAPAIATVHARICRQAQRLGFRHVCHHAVWWGQARDAKPTSHPPDTLQVSNLVKPRPSAGAAGFHLHVIARATHQLGQLGRYPPTRSDRVETMPAVKPASITTQTSPLGQQRTDSHNAQAR